MNDFETATNAKGLLWQLRHNSKLVGVTLILSTIYFTFGYDGGVVAGVLAMPYFNNTFGSQTTPIGNILTPTNISLITALPNIGALLGLPAAAWGGDRFGRKVMILFACVLSLAGAVLQVAAFEIAMLIVGRTLGFMSIFIFLTLATAWLAEICPPNIRGTLASLSIVVIDLAAVITACINQGTKGLTGTASYRIPLGIQILWPCVIALGTFYVFDSPTFYLIKGRNDMAEISLRSVRQGYSEMEILAELRGLQEQASLPQSEQEVSWKELFKGTNLRRTFLALMIANFQILSGIAYATNYATIFLSQVVKGEDPFVLTIGITVLALGGACVGLLLIDRIGRRTLALGTFVPLLIINIIIGGLGFADATNPDVGKAIASFSLMFAFFYAAGFGPLTYVVAGEIPTARLRNLTTTFSFFLLICWTTGATYFLPYLSQSNGVGLGAKIYLIFAGWMLIATITVFFFLPETKGRSAAELDEMFEAGVSAWKFKKYVCRTSVENFAGLAKTETGAEEVENLNVAGKV
ncbi:hypothetical protein VTL71DRAFT_6609 [Oculimacula yallundae]|uniref:Major facilitator superfamily (MFS) profile domain-containing protein n=1 Tax=Oculimacula yallundae TaxID=86028 RepID=A0ABR4BXG9_9HELO